MLGGRFQTARQIQRQLTQKGTEVLELFCAGALVNAKQRRPLERFEELCGGHIGNQHALFDQLVGVVAVHRLDGSDLALLIK